MANELLDFVISLVRDPDAAARYAADPGRAIADAHLTGVTSADVNNLLPIMSDSLSMAAPRIGAFDAGTAVDAGVWTSGAATAAFDAFMPHAASNDAVIHHPEPAVIDAGALPEVHDDAPNFDGFDTSMQFGGAELDHPTFDDEVPGGEGHADDADHGAWGTWEHGHDGTDAGHAGFEIHN
jgi:hypothetical protein